MKQRDFIQHLNRNDCQLLREGGRHSIYFNVRNNKTSAVPRHNELRENLVRKICKDLDIPNP